MSYIYLLEQGEESSAECFSDIPVSVRSKLIPIAGASCCNDSETASCHDSRFGTTCVPLTGDRGAEALTSSRVDSHAKTSPVPAKGPASTATGLDCGPRWPGSLARYDPNTCSWKTRQCLLAGGLEEFSATWPRWGMMRDGECWELATPARLISGKESGLWPTPCARDYKGAGKNGTLRDRLDYATERGATKSNTYATPQSRDFRTGQQSRWEDPERTRNLNDQIGGKLNPNWVEWLMGWPIGWSKPEPIEMDWRDWSEDPADSGEIPRVAKGIKKRVSRLKAIGNGQVPAVAALAWQTLTKVDTEAK